MWAAWCKGQLQWNGWQLTYRSDGLWGCSERKAKSQHGMDWFIRRMILLIMIDHDQCSPYTDSPYGLLRWWRSLLTAGTLELLPKRPKAKRSLLQYLLERTAARWCVVSYAVHIVLESNRMEGTGDWVCSDARQEGTSRARKWRYEDSWS